MQREVQRLRQEAEATERLARVVSYAPDRERLAARAGELRREADALAQRERRTWED